MKAHKYSIETLYHFRCTDCDKWWSIGDFKPCKHLICPHCGRVGRLEEIKDDKR